jgi:rod shape-determining protein MreD
MKRRLLLIPAALFALFLDCFVFPALSGNGFRPLLVSAVALGAVASTKVQDGILVAFFGGLFTDLFCNPYVGLSAAAYLLAVSVLYGFVRKNRPKASLLFLFALAAFLAAEALILVFTLITGARFPIGHRLLASTLPSLIFESLAVLPLAALFRTKEKGALIHR